MIEETDELENLIREEESPAPRSKARIVVPVILLVAAGAGWALHAHYSDRVSTDDAQVDGRVTAIAPKIAGNVVELLVDDNQVVKAGQVLVRIDPRDYQARVDLARAALMQAESQARSAQVAVPLADETTRAGNSAATSRLADAEAEFDRARLAAELAAGSDLAYAEANVRARRANNDRAQADLERMRPLVAKAEISRQQFDAFTAAARVAESELRAAQEKVTSAGKDAQIRRAQVVAAQSKVAQARAMVAQSTASRRQVAMRTADTGTAAAMVAAAKANLDAAELSLSYTTLTSPTDGVVTRKSVQLGHIVQPGQSLMAIVPLNDVWITANYKETDLANVHPGQRAEVHVDMYGRSVAGVVDSIAGATGSRLSLLPPENATGNYVKVVQRIPVKIRVDKRAAEVVLRPGMNVDATIFIR
jgi:membrane fusion protein, multidrug efflux system